MTEGAAATLESQVRENLRRVRHRLDAAGAGTVKLVAITKGFGPAHVEAAAACGITDIGESYAQECAAKLASVNQPLPRVHFVGGLQRNKVRQLAQWVDVWQSVDRSRLVTEIAHRAPGASVMLQVNITGAGTQGGCAPGEVHQLAELVSASGLDLMGLMTIGPMGSLKASADCFGQLRRLVDQMGLRHCSMGMTDDLEVAVSQGSTMVRVGRALFGPRPARQSIPNSPIGV